MDAWQARCSGSIDRCYAVHRYAADTAMDALGGAAGRAGDVSLQLYNSFYEKQHELFVAADNKHQQLAACKSVECNHMELLFKVSLMTQQVVLHASTSL